MLAMRRYLHHLWPMLIALIALSARLLPTPRTIDDAFITFRYARNIVAGAGFVYNLDERVLGTTTPLYTLLMSTLAGLTGSANYPGQALIVNALADAATCWLLVRLGEKLSGQRRVGLAAALLWAIAPMSVTFAIGGMETSVFIFLMVLSADLYLSRRTRWAALASALLLLTRPDGALWVGPLILDSLVRGWQARRLPLAEAGIFFLTLVPWVLFATFYFGSPLPHSIAAKAVAYHLEPIEGFRRLLQHYGTPFFEQETIPPAYSALILYIFIAYLGLSFIGALTMIKRDSRVWPIALYPWLYFAVFAIANPLIFRWYLAPPLPFYFLLILCGVAKFTMDVPRALRIKEEGGKANRWAMITFLLPPACFLLFSLNAWVAQPDHGPSRPAPEMAWHQLELLYEQVGRDLAERGATPQTVVAAGDVGALGYYSNARILDTVGLMSPEASAYYPLDPALYVINYAVAPHFILDYQPDYVVVLEVYGRKGLFVHEDFLRAYTLIQKIETDIYGSDGLLVWQRAVTSPAPE